MERVYSSLSDVQEDTPSYYGLYCMVLWKQRNIAEFEGPTQSTEEILRLVSRQAAESLLCGGLLMGGLVQIQMKGGELWC